MKYATLILAIVFFSCSTDSDKNTDTTDTHDDALHEHADDETEASDEGSTPAEESSVVTETVIVKDSDINEDAAVEATFLSIIDAVNTATGKDTDKAMSFLDKDYVFKGKDRKESVARLDQQFAKYQTSITDVEIRQLDSSCNLAYLIVSFKRAISDRETGEVKVEARDKVGLFIMRKDSAGKWKLLVQKTDDGFAHWFYMPGDK
jgi:ketosteroid isomerase-like protein